MCGRGGRTTFLTDLLSTREPFFSTGFERNCMTAGVGATDAARTTAREAMADGFTKPWHLWPRRGACERRARGRVRAYACAAVARGGSRGEEREKEEAPHRAVGERSRTRVSSTPEPIMAPKIPQEFQGGDIN